MTGKFNTPVESTATTNYEGGLAFTLDPFSELYSRVATCLVREPKFYGEVKDEEKRILELVQYVADREPLFILQLASYARTKLHLRAVPIMLLGEAALNPKCKPFVRKWTPKIIKRADELCEIIGYIKAKIGDIGSNQAKGSLPAALKKGIADAMHNFDRYKYSKYDKNNAQVKMQDVIRLVHPTPKDDEERGLFLDIAKDTLAPADTWEVLISGQGSTKETWTKAARIMPIMALLRNLRNLLDKEVDSETIDYVCSQLKDENKILNSKQFPFRFLSAYKELEDHNNPNASRILSALEDAMDISIKNLPPLNGITAIFADNSGSMDSRISQKSKVMRDDIANLFAAIVARLSPDNVTMSFGETIARINLNNRNGLLNNSKLIDNLQVGGSTNAYLTIAYLLQNKIKVDRIILLSDMQCYDDSRSYYNSQRVKDLFMLYKQSISLDVYFYSFDLAGYGTIQVPEHESRTALIAGWSENIIKYIPVFEEGSETAIKEIKSLN